MRYDFLVVGAGLAGSIVAQQLHERGKRVLVIDRREHFGGNTYDELDEHGILVHRYGPHVFNANSGEVVAYLSKFTSWSWYEHKVLAKTVRGFVPMPINRTTLEQFFDVELETEDDARVFLESKRIPIAQPRTVEQSILSQVGPELYEALFKGYTTKQWGRAPDQLDSIVVGRLPARTNRDDRYATTKFQAMPTEGYTAMFARILDGIEVQLGVDAADVVPADFGHVVWTGPIDEAFGFKLGKLPWRSLRFELQNLKTDGGLVQPVGVLNYPDEAIPYTRTTEYRHLTGQWASSTTLHYEFPSDEGDPYYPVPAPDSRELFGRYTELAREHPHITFVGRLARYQYLAMHQVVAQALKAARGL